MTLIPKPIHEELVQLRFEQRRLLAATPDALMRDVVVSKSSRPDPYVELLLRREASEHFADEHSARQLDYLTALADVADQERAVTRLRTVKGADVEGASIYAVSQWRQSRQQLHPVGMGLHLEPWRTLVEWVPLVVGADAVADDDFQDPRVGAPEA
jgi:hypothetical protein